MTDKLLVIAQKRPRDILSRGRLLFQIILFSFTDRHSDFYNQQ